MVFHVFDPSTRSMVSCGLATSAAEHVGQWWLLAVDENAQGGRDVNQNGTVGDHVYYAFDPTLGALSLDASHEVTALMEADADQGVAFFVASERSDGFDWNEDGDQDDWVPLVLEDTILGVRSTHMALGFLAGWTFFEGGIGFVGSEAGQGQDLNDDGDQVDRVVVTYDFATHETTSLELEGRIQPGAERGLVLLRTEWEDGVDWNEDGALDDVVLFVWSSVSNVLTNTGLAAAWVQDSLGDRYAITVREVFLGEDLNEDGDDDDSFLIDYVDPTVPGFDSGRIEEVNAVVARYQTPFRILALVQEETIDLNEDGDLSDTVLQVLTFFERP